MQEQVKGNRFQKLVAVASFICVLYSLFAAIFGLFVLRDRSFFMSMGGWWDLGGGGGTRKKMSLKWGGYQKKFSERGGVTSNNWLVREIESGSTQKQMKKLNIISILFNTIFLSTFNLFYILRSKSAFHITTTEEMKHICWKSNNEYKLK